jgi:gas vesicle protein
MGSGKVVLGVLAGVAIGATLGILLAPDKGSVTRRKISDKADDYTEGLEEKFSEFIKSVTQQFEAMRAQAADAAAGAATTVEHAANTTAEAAAAEVSSVIKY